MYINVIYEYILSVKREKRKPFICNYVNLKYEKRISDSPLHWLLDSYTILIVLVGFCRLIHSDQDI